MSAWNYIKSLWKFSAVIGLLTFHFYAISVAETKNTPSDMAKPSQAKPSLDDYEVVSSDFFMTELTQSIVPEICQNGSKWTTCYEITEKQCSLEIGNLIKECRQKIRFPASIYLSRQSGYYSSKVGLCVGKAFSKKFERKFVRNEFCGNRDFWSK